MTKVICFGTFDILHPGHIYFFKECKKMGGDLIVVVARDKTVKKVRGRMARNDEKLRNREIKKLRIANQVILGDVYDPYKIIEKIRPDVICLGYDQKVFTDGLSKELEKRGVDCQVVRIGAFKPEKYKSSKLLNCRATEL